MNDYRLTVLEIIDILTPKGLGMDKETLLRAIRRGELPEARLWGRKYKIPVNTVHNWLIKHKSEDSFLEWYNDWLKERGK